MFIAKIETENAFIWVVFINFLKENTEKDWCLTRDTAADSRVMVDV